MKTLTVIGWRRPDYLRQVLKSLRRCIGIREYKVWVMIDHGCLETLAVAVGESMDSWSVTYAEKPIGCNGMTRFACETGFAFSDYHIHLEDDCVPAKDCLCWFEWASRFKADDSVFSVSGYSKETGRLDAYGRRSWFTPWGWATWRSRWGQMLSWWREEARYPWAVQTNHWARQCRMEVYPVVARIQNIGRNGGANVNPEQWEREQKNVAFAGESKVREWA